MKRSPWPPVPSLPRMPDLSEGRCVPGHSAIPPEAWTAEAAPDEREAAILACASCPVLAACREYAIESMPGLCGVTGILAGMNRKQIEDERRRRRREDGQRRYDGR